MLSYCKEGTGRLVILCMKRGELLLESIRNELAKHGIKDAVILSAIGSLSKAVLHRVTTMDIKAVDEFITIEKPMELSSLQGFVLDGHPHFHMVISDLEKTYTGHLEDGTTVLYLAEISLLELKNTNLKRVTNAAGLAEIIPRN